VAGTTAVALAALAPIWTTEVLPTGDGPSHVYNAFVANELDRAPALAEVYELGPPLRPQLLSDSFLRATGPIVGWWPAERLLFTVIVVAGVVALAALAGVRDPTALAILIWIPGGWFAWMGFYDFALGLAFLALLARSLERGEERAPHVWMVLLLASHLFLAACGSVLLAARWLADRRRDTLVAWVGWAALTAGLLFGATPGGLSPPVPAPNGLAHVLTSDPVLSHDPGGMVAGFCLFLMAVAGAWSRCRDRGVAALFGWLGVLFVLASLVAPEWIGRGGYVPTRMRGVALVLLAPAGVGALWRRGGVARAATVACAVAAWSVLVHQAMHTRAYAHRLAETVRSIEAAVDALGPEPGGVALIVRDPFQQPGFGRVFAWERIPERIALPRSWPVLDDYEAGEPVFRVRWKGAGAPLSLALRDSTLSVGGPWARALYLVHDSDVDLSTDRDLGRTLSTPPFATTFFPAVPSG